MSHLPGCPCNSADVYATCACDQIRVSMHTEALDNNTRALQDHESLQTEVDSLRARLAAADAARAAARKSLFDLTESANAMADELDGIHRTFDQSVIDARKASDETNAARIAALTAENAALREDRERIMQSYEYCVNRSLEHIADKKPTLAVCILEMCQKSLNKKRAEMQAALHPATKEGKAT